MRDDQFTIFRKRALSQYIQRQEQMVSPHLISPLMVVLLWILLVVLLITMLLVLSGIEKLLG